MSIYTKDRGFDLTGTPQKILSKDHRRFSWDITNDGANPVYFKRGPAGRDVAAAGENRGLVIAVNATDGMDEEDATDEVWIIGTVGDTCYIMETNLPVTLQEYKGYPMLGGGSRRLNTTRRS